MMQYRSIADLNQTILDNLGGLPRDLDLVVGIPRSGLLAANILALHLNLPLTDLDGLISGRLIAGGQRMKSDHIPEGLRGRLNIIVLDDLVSTGRAMGIAKTKIESANLPHNITFGTVYASPLGAVAVDICFEIIPERHIFEWQIMHSRIMERSCVDIDGVLCHDPSKEQDDDGSKYAEFLANAEPLYLSSVPIGWLVTSRLEKYRKLTEEWLARHNVTYHELIMMDLPSKEARLAGGSPGKFKAEVYAKTRASLFVESSSRQARVIAARTGKPVFCFETRRMEGGGFSGSARRTPVNVREIIKAPYRRLRNLGRGIRRRAVSGRS